MTDARIAFTMFESPEQAKHFARHIVERRFAACVNLVENVHSVYRWKEKIESTPEVLVIIKTTVERIDTLKDVLSAFHSYQVPEFIVLEIEEGGAAYLSWLLAASRDPE